MTMAIQLEDKDYLFIRDLIQERTGMLIAETRRNILTRALKDSAIQSKCADIPSYVAHLVAAETDSETWDNLVKKLTIGESYFFRHQEQINALRQNILPDLIARHWTDRTLHLWSAGCATGEEPYTIAILLREFLPDIERWKIMILATDINRQALTQAAAGRYREWSLRDTNPQMREKYFTCKGDIFTLNPAIRQMVTFAYLNLSEDRYPSTINHTHHVDLILCRNVTIYLPHPVISDIAMRFHKSLAPGGWLIVAPSETNLEIYSKFQTLVFYGNVIYQKMGRAPESIFPPPEDQRHVRHARKIPDSEHQPIFPTFSPKQTVPPPMSIAVTVPAEPAGVRQKGESPAPKQDESLYEQGEALMKERHYDHARRCFLAYLAKKPDSISTRYRLCCLEANTGHLDEARKYAEQALQGDPMHSKLHYVMGIIQQTQEKLEEALMWFKKTIYLDPDFILAHFSISHIYERTGKHEEAKRHRALAARLACQLSPDLLLPGSDDLTAGQLLGMVKANKGNSNTSSTGRGV